MGKYRAKIELFVQKPAKYFCKDENMKWIKLDSVKITD